MSTESAVAAIDAAVEALMAAREELRQPEPQPQPPPDSGTHRGLVSVAEAAAHLGVSRGSIYRLIGDGRIRTVKIGSRVLVPPSELERIINGGELR